LFSVAYNSIAYKMLVVAGGHFIMVSQHALSQYQQVNTAALVENASPHKLIQMLMQGCMQRLAEAKGALQRKDVPAKGLAIGKAIDIIGGLQSSLNKQVAGSALPQQLDSLYGYMQQRLLEANLKNDMTIVDEVAGLMRTVKEGWDGIEPAAAPR
jgi:flagellar protein FliS